MNQEYHIKSFVIDLKDQDKSVFLPPGAQILEVSYEVLTRGMDMVLRIGGQDRLALFMALRYRLSWGVDWEARKDILEEAGFQDLEFCQYDPKIFTETRMVIKALVPAPKPKGKYA